MEIVQPKVYLVAETRLFDTDEFPVSVDGPVTIGDLGDYLDEVGAGDWETDAKTDAEILTEACGRMCYRSWKPGLNENVTKVREGNDLYLKNILKSKHGSVLEHVTMTFLFHNVSRVFTHELVRHRAGCAISQESMRYVAIKDFKMVVPVDTLTKVEELLEGSFMSDAADAIASLERIQHRVREAMDAKTGLGFHEKKVITSFMRRFIPDGIATGIAWTANIRSLRHVIAMRTSEQSEEEIRGVFDRVAEICKWRFPNLFQDFTRSQNAEWTPDYMKV